MRMNFLIYEEMRKYLTIYEKAVSHMWHCNRSLLNFLIYEEIFFSFLSVCTVQAALQQRMSSCYLLSIPAAWWYKAFVLKQLSSFRSRMASRANAVKGTQNYHAMWVGRYPFRLNRIHLLWNFNFIWYETFFYLHTCTYGRANAVLFWRSPLLPTSRYIKMSIIYSTS